MARRKGKGRRRRRGISVIPFNVNLAASVSVNNEIKSVSLVGVLEEDFYAVSMDISIELQDATPGEGPRRIGFAHGDYSITEISECLDVTLLGPDNKIEQERSKRLVRTIGKLKANASEESLNEGLPIRKKIGWVIGDGEVFNLWHRNLSLATLTTGSSISAEGLIYGRWLR